MPAAWAATPPGVLRREPPVDVVVSAQDEPDAVVVQRLPERLHRSVAAVHAAGAEARIMEDGERADRKMRRQIGTQPLLLRQAGATAADLTAVVLT